MNVYADNAATTQVRQEVIDTINENNINYGNPSCIHSMGLRSRNLIENARSQIAESIGAKPNEIIFTSSGTESNNLALQGFVNANNYRGHIITTAIEHMSVLNPIWYLYDMGYDITILPVDSEGRINLHQLQNSIRRNTVLISIMFANNEIGTIQPIREIGEIARRYNICFHTDAIQAIGHCDINVNKLNIKMMSISGHKAYAPKGIGALYVKNNIELSPMIYGSNQEYGLRSGTENINGIIGMGKAIELLDKAEKQRIAEYLTTLKYKLIDGIKVNISNVKFNGNIENGLCNIVNVSFKGVNGEDLLMLLDSNGIYVSNGSPYLPHKTKPSHVMDAIGVRDIPIRFSLGKDNTENEIDCILDVLPDLVKKLRNESNSV